MSEAKRIKYVSFRLTDEEYTEIEEPPLPPAMTRTTGAGTSRLLRLVKARSLAKPGV